MHFPSHSMPSAPLHPRPSQQHLDEFRTGNQHAPIASKLLPQAYATHRRDTPINGASDFRSLDRRTPGGNAASSPGLRMNAEIHSVPDGSQALREMAAMPT